MNDLIKKMSGDAISTTEAIETLKKSRELITEYWLADVGLNDEPLSSESARELFYLRANLKSLITLLSSKKEEAA